MKKIVLVGAGGHCKVIIEAIDQNEYEIAGILDSFTEPGKKICGIPVIGSDDTAKELLKDGVLYAVVALVGDLKLRGRLLERYKNMGFQFPNVIHPAAFVSESVKLGEGVVILANACVNTEASIGDFATINTAAIVEHEVCVGKNSHIAPGAILLGGACVGRNTLIGAGSTLLQLIKVGDDCIVGAGSVVIKNIAPKSMAFGNPAKSRE